MKRRKIELLVWGSVLVGEFVQFLYMNKKIKKLKDHAKKMHGFYTMLVSWLAIRQNNMSLEKYFQQKGYRKIAIYGMKELGERFYEELQDSNIEVLYAIDKNAEDIYAKCEVLNPEDRLEDVDVIVVTAIHFFDEIKETMYKKINCPIVSITDIIHEIENSRGAT